MKKVMIAIDYGPTAQTVAEAGFKLAKSMEAEIILLHVISDPMYYATRDFAPIMGFNGYADMSPIQLDSAETLKKASLDFLDRTKEHLGDTSIKTIVEKGDFADNILKAAKKSEADIIVMGSHSRKWLENILMGSVTENVLHHTSIPLFIVPTKKTK